MVNASRQQNGGRAPATLRLSLVQMLCEKGAVARNLDCIEAHIRNAAARGTDIICFPEMSITGYIDPSRWSEAVLSLDGPEVARFAAMTAGAGLTAIAGLVEHNPDGRPFITQVVVADGRLSGYYRKTTIPPDEAPWFAPGAGHPLFHHRGVPFGVAICADIDNPAVFAAKAARGARLVFEAAAPGLYGEQATRDWASGHGWWRSECEAKLGCYAREHGIDIAVATQAGRTVDEDFPGGGYLFGPDGALLAATPDWSPGVLDVEMTLTRATLAE
jgi:predicted amidohydrolase